MASGFEGEPGVSSTKLHLLFSVLDELRSLNSKYNVSIKCIEDGGVKIKIQQRRCL